MGVLIRGENVCKNFGGLAALNGVNFEVREGEIFGLIGPNGAGKTTIFNMVAGVYAPDSGEISIGENIPLQTNVGGSNLGSLAGLAGGAAGALVARDAPVLVGFTGLAPSVPAAGAACPR